MSDANEPNPDETHDVSEAERAEAERRDSVVDRRTGGGRRGGPASKVATDQAKATQTGLERRRGPGRRRSDYVRSAEEGEMTPEQYLFVRAIDVFKRVNNRSFPTWTEVLEVMRRLGYRKTMSSELNLKGVEDWTEAPDAEAMPTAMDGDDDTEASDEAA